MTRLGLYIAASWTLFCTYSVAMPDIHRQMSTEHLREVFHVDHPDAVPHYELIQLTHHTNQPSFHYRRKRSIETAPSSKGGGSGNSLQGGGTGTNNHHVKKDLSKVRFSEKVSESQVPAKKRPVAKQVATTGAAAPPIVASEQEQILLEMQPQQPQQQQQQEPESVNVNESDGSDDSNSRVSDVSIRDINQHRVSFSAFGENLNLTLEKTEGLFRDGPHSLRMWNVRVDPNATQGLVYEEIHEENPAEEDSFGNIYQDQQNMAAVLMRKHLESGDLMMEGSIGHELVIKPVPTDISRAEDGSVHHVIYKRTVSEEHNDHASDYAFMEPDRLQKRFRSKRQAPYYKSSRALDTTIYPEILVIVDYDGYRLHGGDNVQVKRYFVSFWNGVDLRYRLLKGPRIRISIAGIIISRGRDATPYLERNRVGRDAIDSAAALTDMGKYLFRERRLPVYDIAVAITKLDMCRRQYANDACNRGTAGFAYVGGACVVNKRLEKVNSVAIIEDTGGFSGIIVAAHEVGHLLGAVHDGSPPPSYLGGPGAEKCRWEDGYIMSDLRHTERGFRWSPCSVQSFHHFLNGDTASCLHNPPHEDEALGRALPGTLLTLDAQCRRDRGTSACFKDERVCAQLFCFDSASGYCVAYRPAAEGSTCGDGQHCLDGKCVAEHENIIPDYSQHTPSYARFNQQPVKYNYDDKSGQQEEYYEPSSSTSSTTTTSTTTTTTSTTTTPPPPPPTSTRNYYQYFNHKSTSTYHSNLHSTSSSYNGNSNHYNHHNNDNQQQSTTESDYYRTKATKTPYVFSKYTFSSTKSPYTYSQFTASSTTPSTTSTSTPFWDNRNNNNHQQQQQYQHQQSNGDGASFSSGQSTTTTTHKPKSTYHPVFDVYFNRIAQTTTRNPYNFSFYVKRTTKSPNYALNYVGANSQISFNRASISSSSGGSGTFSG